MSITKQQIKYSDFVGSLGQSEYDFTKNGEFTIVEKLLSDYAKLFITEAQDNLEKQKKVYKGNTSHLVTDFLTTPTLITMYIGYDASNPASQYYAYVDEGVDGVYQQQGSRFKFKNLRVSPKMLAQIKEWVDYHRITFRKEDQKKKLSGLQKKRKSLSEMSEKMGVAYIIARSIKAKGLKKTNYFTDAIDALNASNFRKDVAEAFGIQINIVLSNTTKENK